MYESGKKYHYSNTDYILLGLIIEKATGKTIKDNFDHYFKKYKLTNTYYLENQAQIKNRLAHGYNRDGTLKYNTDVYSFSDSFTQSSGAIISTPTDVTKWLHDLFSKKIISAKSLNEMTSLISEKSINNKNIKSFLEVGTGSGIGLIYFKKYGFAWVHAGGTLGYESFYVYNPCTGIYLSLMYSVKPKQQLEFMEIGMDVFEIIAKSCGNIKRVNKSLIRAKQ